ncbi:probable glutamate carboxypeptidase AMP1 [Aristolochia californica]|uniref:probable glutamate carboxypeptidase AMP1 n=1 Tax=Aristolochia californica TaxID=171875 RepID=UPI0035E0C6DA
MAFDTFEWMPKSENPLFHHPVAVAEIWGLLTLHLADSSILPFNYLSYAAQLQEHRQQLSSNLECGISLYPIDMAFEDVVGAAHETETKASTLGQRQALSDFSELSTRLLNDQMLLSARGFVDADDLNGRLWFKHLIYGPPGDSNSDLSLFPGIPDAQS